MVLEIFVYLVISFGILILCITMIEKDEWISNNYVLFKRDNAKVKVVLETEGLSEEDSKRIAWILRNGKYQNIYDIANDFELLIKENV